MPSAEETTGSWASWLPFQCMPLPFGSHRPSTLPPTSAPSNTKDDARRANTSDGEKRSKSSGGTGADKSLVYEEPQQHPRPTTAPETSSRQLGLSNMFTGSRENDEEEDGDSVTSTTRVVIIPRPPGAESAERPKTQPSSKADGDIHRRTISAPMEFRHLCSGAHLAQALPAHELRRILASKALKANFEAECAADKQESKPRRLQRQRSLPSFDFSPSRGPGVGASKSSAFAQFGHDIAVPQIKTLPAESTPTTPSFENSITCGIMRSRSVPTVKKPQAAETTNAASRPSTASSDKTKVSDDSEFPPPPLPLILLPNAENGQPAPGSFSAKGGNRTNPPPNVLTNSPVPLKPKDGFYQAVSLGGLFDYGSNYSLDSATTWNTDDLYGVPPTLSPTNKVVMRRVQHGVPQIMSVEGIHGLSPPVRNRYSIQREK